MIWNMWEREIHKTDKLFHDTVNIYCKELHLDFKNNKSGAEWVRDGPGGQDKVGGTFAPLSKLQPPFPDVYRCT